LNPISSHNSAVILEDQEVQLIDAFTGRMLAILLKNDFVSFVEA
jgi:preprotein translocase subunit SecA